MAKNKKKIEAPKPVKIRRRKRHNLTAREMSRSVRYDRLIARAINRTKRPAKDIYANTEGLPKEWN